jgi:hypothetical protein
MARKLEPKIAVWMSIAAVSLAAATAAFFAAKRGGVPLPRRVQYGLGLALGGVTAILYSFSVRKWALVFLYRSRIFRPAEIAQDAATRARSEISDLQGRVDSGVLTSPREIRAKAREVLARYGVERAFAVGLVRRRGAPPRIDLVRRESFGKLEQWLYAHAVFGAAAIPIALYHADASLGGPVSAALLVTFLGACLSGLAGGWLYWTLPGRLASAEAGLGYEETLRQIERVDEEIHAAEERKDKDLLAVLGQEKERLLAHFAPQRKRKLLLAAWLAAHVPLAGAALALFIAHVLSVWWY